MPYRRALPYTRMPWSGVPLYAYARMERTCLDEIHAVVLLLTSAMNIYLNVTNRKPSLFWILIWQRSYLRNSLSRVEGFLFIYVISVLIYRL